MEDQRFSLVLINFWSVDSQSNFIPLGNVMCSRIRSVQRA